MKKANGARAGVSRRLALGLGLSGGLAACATPTPAYQGRVNFAHGVASGDPLADRVVIWTRVTPETDGPVPVRWVVARDRDLTRVIRSGVFTTDSSRDHTVKVDVDGLPSGATLFYGFSVGETASPIGRTKTAPTGPAERAKVAVCSCSNHPFGLFNAYDAMAKIEDLDLVLHLGDYIYEYGLDGYGGQVGVRIGRPPQPPKEILTVADYRARHAQYKSDPGLQAAHAAAPWLVVWDDHETANDSWLGGAEQHQPATEGDWQARKSAALQAYFEWMPIRDMAPGRAREAIYRSVAWGDLIRIVMLESRLTARARQIEYETDLTLLPDGTPDIAAFQAKLADPDRRLLGPGQMNWLAETFASSRSSAWRLIGNQIILAKQVAPDLSQLPEPVIEALAKQFPPIRDFIAISRLGVPLNLDAWDGYPAERERLYALLKQAGPTVVVTGDTHAAWANECHAADGTLAAVEFGTTSITSPSIGDLFGPFDIGAAVVARSPEVLWTDQKRRGYLTVTFTREEALAEYFAVSTILAPDYSVERIKAYRARRVGDAVSTLTEA